MPNAIKYSTGSETQALKKGNFYIATGDVDKGTTGASGYWNGITPPAGGYTIFLNKASNGPSIYVASSDSELISLTNIIAGANYSTKQQCFQYFNTQTDKMVFNIDYPSIITNGLVLNYDAAFIPSYPTSGTTIYDLSSSGVTGTLTNGPTFSSNDGGSIVFDGSDDYINCGSSLLFAEGFTIMMYFKTTVNELKVMAGKYSGANYDWWIGANPTKLKFSISLGAGVKVEPTSTTTINNGTWFFGAASYNKSTLSTSIYINGVKEDTKVGNNLFVEPNPPFVIGNFPGSSFYFPGNIATTQVYNRALTDAEIVLNYEAIGRRFTSLSVQSLVVAGGGSGGGYGYPSGGGGAGGLLTGTTSLLTTNTNYSVIIGAGGSANSNGSNSVFNTTTAIGGGRGGNGRSGAGVSGGSGGGGATNYPQDGGLVNYLTPAGSGTVGQGNNGGVGKSVYGDTRLNGVPTGAGGGGGAGAVGGTGTTTPSTKAGNGGVGLYFSEYSTIGGYPSGWFAGGGGGSTSYSDSSINAIGLGGNGGGGNGSYTSFSSGPSATDGKINTGGGGGGAGYIESSSANGGSGIVILRIPDVYNAVFSSGVGWSVSKANGYKYYKVTATSTTSETVYFY